MLRRCKPEADNLASTIKGSGLKWKEIFFNYFFVKLNSTILPLNILWVILEPVYH